MHYDIQTTTGYLYGTAETMSKARERAIQVAASEGALVSILRVIPEHTHVDTDGNQTNRPESRKVVMRIMPDGTARAPEGSTVPGPVSQCKKRPGGPPCFCQNCRAERR